jgi:hypothetical protein
MQLDAPEHCGHAHNAEGLWRRHRLCRCRLRFLSFFFNNVPVVLMLLDWAACTNSCLDANLKLILVYYAVLLSMLRTLDKHLHGETG